MLALYSHALDSNKLAGMVLMMMMMMMMLKTNSTILKKVTKTIICKGQYITVLHVHVLTDINDKHGFFRCNCWSNINAIGLFSDLHYCLQEKDVKICLLE